MVVLRFFIEGCHNEKQVSRNDAEQFLQDQRGNVILRSGSSSASIVCSHTGDIKPYYVFDSKVHQIDGCLSADVAIEMAELSIMVDEA